MIRILDIVSTIEVICLVTAVVTLSNDKKRFWRASLAFIIFVCLTEIVIGRYVAIKYHNNIWVYNIFIFFENAFISYGIYTALKKYTKPRLLVSLGALLTYLFYFGFIIKNGILEFNSISVSVMSVIFVIYCFYYYYLVLTDDEIIEINTNPEFWWITAILFYYFGGTTTNLFFDLFSKISFNGFSLRYIINIVLNILLYGLWAYSFICRAKQRKLLS